MDAVEEGAESEPLDIAASISGTAGGAASLDASAAPATEGSSEFWALQNAADRKFALRFLIAIPLGFLLWMRLLMGPLRQYMDKQFWAGR